MPETEEGLSRPQAVLGGACLFAYLALLLPAAVLEYEEVELPLLSAAHLYLSLIPISYVPKLLARPIVEPVVAAACMSAVVRAHVAEAATAGALFDAVFFASTSALSTPLPAWGRAAGVVAAACDAATSLTLVDGVELPAALGLMAATAECLYMLALGTLLLARVR